MQLTPIFKSYDKCVPPKINLLSCQVSGGDASVCIRVEVGLVDKASTRKHVRTAELAVTSRDDMPLLSAKDRKTKQTHTYIHC